MRRTTSATCLLLVLLSACATSPRSETETETRRRNLIEAGEIASVSATNTFDLIRHLRPEYLRSRGSLSFRGSQGTFAVVYMSGVRLGGLEQLRAINPTDVRAIRYISAPDATTRWGVGHAGGVIEIIPRS